MCACVLVHTCVCMSLSYEYIYQINVDIANMTDMPATVSKSCMTSNNQCRLHMTYVTLALCSSNYTILLYSYKISSISNPCNLWVPHMCFYMINCTSYFYVFTASGSYTATYTIAELYDYIHSRQNGHALITELAT